MAHLPEGFQYKDDGHDGPLPGLESLEAEKDMDHACNSEGHHQATNHNTVER